MSIYHYLLDYPDNIVLIRRLTNLSIRLKNETNTKNPTIARFIRLIEELKVTSATKDSAVAVLTCDGICSQIIRECRMIPSTDKDITTVIIIVEEEFYRMKHQLC